MIVQYNTIIQLVIHSIDSTVPWYPVSRCFKSLAKDQLQPRTRRKDSFKGSLGLARDYDDLPQHVLNHAIAAASSCPQPRCGLVRTPLGIVPEPQKCAGCYSVSFTGWGAATLRLHSQAGRRPRGLASQAPDQLRGPEPNRADGAARLPKGPSRCYALMYLPPL